MVGARAEPQVPRLVRLSLLGVAEELERLVGQVLGQVVAVSGQVGLIDVVVVLGEVRIPLVRLPAHEPVEAVVPQAQRPVLLGRSHRPRVDGRVVVLADPERAPPGVPQHGRHRRALPRDVRVVAREAGRRLGDRGEPVLVVVAAREERRARRRAQRRRVPLRVGQAVRREAVHRRHVDPPAVRRPGPAPGVVVQHDQDVRRPIRCAVGEKRGPVGGRIPNVELDLSAERLRHDDDLSLSARNSDASCVADRLLAFQRARMRLLRGLCSSSTRPRCSSSGGTYIANRPR